ncbi:unnamed protein product [Cryptosporidium hominis]|uniref:Uncharacterized protein n=1 Tax=Cryptosporidium hominis TaxID=237895 RepID=A0A0S4TBQ0_CRYHO|nr:Uncharacterized protein GY17_00002214 [Cryptosporidium hominis]CUV04617.1 unnamed protein product [Cryptosporidium hominis]|eukprot:PPS95092.1 Uncharacterized protein GY17_00002214 [Cryptosporidium hominis]
MISILFATQFSLTNPGNSLRTFFSTVPSDKILFLRSKSSIKYSFMYATTNLAKFTSPKEWELYGSSRSSLPETIPKGISNGSFPPSVITLLMEIRLSICTNGSSLLLANFKRINLKNAAESFLKIFL